MDPGNSSDNPTLIRRYGSYLQRSSKLFAQEFGYDLSDPLADMCARLGEGSAFSFSRFGDGELNAIFGVDGANCDGHRYFPELGRRLAEILARRPGYVLGLQPLAILVHGAERVRSVSAGIRWVFAGCLHWASIEGRLGGFLDALADREVVLVGAPHHRQLAKARSWRFVEVAYGDCWPQYESLRATLESRAVSSGIVFLFCASMTANVLIDDLHQLNGDNTYIDAGSVFDPYVGVHSRNYHEMLSPEL